MAAVESMTEPGRDEQATKLERIVRQTAGRQDETGGWLTLQLVLVQVHTQITKPNKAMHMSGTPPHTMHEGLAAFGTETKEWLDENILIFTPPKKKRL